MRVEVGDEVLDVSYKNKLQKLENFLIQKNKRNNMSNNIVENLRKEIEAFKIDIKTRSGSSDGSF